MIGLLCDLAPLVLHNQNLVVVELLESWKRLVSMEVVVGEVVEVVACVEVHKVTWRRMKQLVLLLVIHEHVLVQQDLHHHHFLMYVLLHPHVEHKH